MDPLDYYVLQARTNGQPDQITRQQLLQVGWSTEQVNNALNLTIQTNNSVKGKNKISKPVIALLSLSVVTIIVFILGIALSPHKADYITVADQFISAVQKGNQTVADALQSQALTNNSKKATGIASYEKFCRSIGQYCLGYFSSPFIDQASVSHSSYTSTNGTKVATVTFKHSDIYPSGTSCAGTSYTRTLTIKLIPDGSSWLIDSVSPNITNSDSSCNPS